MRAFAYPQEADKKKAFSETYRIIKPGGHFSVSDIVLIGKLPKTIENAAVMYAGCVSGAVQKEEYIELVKDAGFVNISIQKDKRIELPNDLLLNYLSMDEVNQFRNSGIGIFSITVYAEKPS